MPDRKSPRSIVKQNEGGIVIRAAQREDGADLWRMTKAAGTLDLNSPYAYMMMARYFGATCTIAEKDGEPGGFVLAYRLPEQPEALFVWQVAVLPAMRRLGLGRRMILDTLTRPAGMGVTRIQATVTPSNAASRGLFTSIARVLDTSLDISDGFSAAEFPGDGATKSHEREDLFDIGPFEPPAP